MRNGGAAHKNMEAPRSINNGDALSWHASHQSPVTSHQSLETPNPWSLIPAFKLQGSL